LNKPIVNHQVKKNADKNKLIWVEMGKLSVVCCVQIESSYQFPNFPLCNNFASAGHFPQEEKPASVIDKLKKWLNKIQEP